MALTDTILPYEILVRYGQDGQIQGAHQQRRRIVKDGDTVLVDQPLPAEALGIADFPTSAVMTQTTQDALAKVDSLGQQIVALDAAMGESVAQIAADVAAITDLQQQLAAAQAEIAGLRAQLEAIGSAAQDQTLAPDAAPEEAAP